MMGERVLTAEHPTRGRLFAVVAPEARFTGAPALHPTRMGALAAPFGSNESALAAIKAAGAKVKEKDDGLAH